MIKALKVYGKFLDILEKILSVILAILLAAMVLIFCYQVFLRYVLHGANAWSEDLTRYLFVYTVLLGAGIATRKASHLTVDMFIDLLPKRVKAGIQIIFCGLIYFFLFFLFTEGMSLVQNTMKSISASLRVPMAYFYLAIPIGAVLMMLNLFEYLCHRILILVGREDAWKAASDRTEEEVHE
jgi:TRAP-type C4-dicarboxylate transport system permease small subunit